MSFALLALLATQIPGEADPFAPLLALDAVFDADGRPAVSPTLTAELGAYALLLQARDLRRNGQARAVPALLAPLLAHRAKDVEPLVAANARLELAEAALALGRPREARDLQRAVLAHRSFPAELLALAAEGLGRSQRSLGDLSGARVAFGQAAALDPDGEAAERALTALDSMPQSEPEGKSGGHAALARARRMLRHGQAEAALHELAAIRAEGAMLGEVELAIAQCERVLGRADETEIHLAKALRATNAQSGAPARIALARERELSGDWRGAVADLTDVATHNPKAKAGTDALYLAAFMALQHRDTGTARTLFTELLPGRHWQHADEARWWLGWIAFQTATPAQALEEWKPLVSGDGSLAVQTRYWSARAEDSLGHPAEAERLRADLLNASPLGYYALLLRKGEAPLAAEGPPTCDIQAIEPDLDWLARLRRAETLWALGHADYAAEEMHVLAERVSPERILALSDVVAQLGDPGWAFNLVVDRAQPCFRSGPPLSPVLFPRPYADAVNHAARATEVDPLLLWAIMRQESHFHARARSAAQAFGPMQLLDTTAARVAAITGTVKGDPDDPVTALVMAAWYLRALADRFGANPAVLAAAYNAGPSAVGRWLSEDMDRPLEHFAEEVPFRETRRYVKTVLANFAAYHGLFGQADGSLVDPSLPVANSGTGAGVDF